MRRRDRARRGTAESDAGAVINGLLAGAHLSGNSPAVSIAREAIPGDPEGRLS